ncbi:hypothetical protein; putative exported protein [Cupriavidus taiwanensis LMG 19424]|uniref:Uncharacterized protein n=1 Tax=Cupriavidus taiwanensis (strain DSM 17343 / BCRC 17206 / CCUG 44338 / CIP 107171 / LMG 19424 / R1) TaxID=977880 RepID=B3RCG8_CUPTR|nr:hypothetical protein; putative exported protein [Cupriavidus taiwanensis LMG 19424]
MRLANAIARLTMASARAEPSVGTRRCLYMMSLRLQRDTAPAWRVRALAGEPIQYRNCAA